MKRTALLLPIYLYCLCLFAQKEINKSFKTQMSFTFEPLDKTKIPHNILLDYGMEFTNILVYNGMLSDSTYSDVETIKQIYNTLLSSRIQINSNNLTLSSSTGFVTPQEYDERWQNNRSTGVITLSGLYFKYSKFLDKALFLNKLTFTGDQFYDKYIEGVWQNPYEEGQTFAIAPAIRKYNGLNFFIKIPSNIFYSNYPNLIQSIQIDFGNGQGYVSVPLDQNISVSYIDEGIKTWKYKINMINGTILYNQSKMRIEKGINVLPYSQRNNNNKK
jgi:hypothetical protein